MCDSLRSMPASVDAHAIVFQRMEGGLTTSRYATDANKTDGVVLIASVGRGDVTAFVPPNDNKNASPFTQLGETHTYTLWPRFGHGTVCIGRWQGRAESCDQHSNTTAF